MNIGRMICMTVAICSTSITFSDDWSMFGHDSRRSYQSASVLEPPLEHLPDIPLPNGFGGPPISRNGNLILSAPKPGGTSEIGYLSELNGTLVWQQALRKEPGDIVAGDAIYIALQDTHPAILALNPDSGSEIWRFETNLQAVFKGLALGSNQLFATAYGRDLRPTIFAFDPANGTKLWQQRLDGIDISPPSSHNGMVFAVTHNEYAGPIISQGGVYAVNPSGEIKWKNTVTDEAVSPALSGNRVFVYSSSALFSINIETGKTVWERTLSSFGRQLAVTGDSVLALAADFDGHLLAFDPITGSPLWERTFLDSPFISFVSGSGEFGYVTRTIANIRTNLMAVPTAHVVTAINLRSGEPVWEQSFPLGTVTGYSSAIIANEKLLMLRTASIAPTNVLVSLSGRVSPGSPSVSLQPPNAHIARAGELLILSASVAGFQPDFFQWYFDRTPIPGATQSTYSFTATPEKAGQYYIFASNTGLSVRSHEAIVAVMGDPSATLGMLPDPARLYPELARDSTKRNIVVATHGFQATGARADITWLDDMVAHLRGVVSDTWQVEAYEWLEASQTIRLISHAEAQGIELGKQLLRQQWEHIHLIGHSAGSMVIQSAVEYINESSSGLTIPTIHTTFLDPYVGVTFEGQSKYGKLSDWADSYYVRDLTGPRTETELTHAFNIDITPRAKDSILVPVIEHGVFRGYVHYLKSPILDPFSGHAWPHEFYDESIYLPFLSKEFGFSISMEADGWDRRTNYHVGTGVSLSPTEPPRIKEYRPPIKQQTRVAVDDSPSVLSTNAAIENGTIYLASRNDRWTQPSASLIRASSDVGRTNGGPWASLAVSVSNDVNVVSFDARFVSTNASGLLTVYWNTNLIGYFDERAISYKVKPYIVELPKTFRSGVYTINLKLTSFTDAVSSLSVSNISLEAVS